MADMGYENMDIGTAQAETEAEAAPEVSEEAAQAAANASKDAYIAQSASAANATGIYQYSVEDGVMTSYQKEAALNGMQVDAYLASGLAENDDTFSLKDADLVAAWDDDLDKSLSEEEIMNAQLTAGRKKAYPDGKTVDGISRDYMDNYGSLAANANIEAYAEFKARVDVLDKDGDNVVSPEEAAALENDATGELAEQIRGAQEKISDDFSSKYENITSDEALADLSGKISEYNDNVAAFQKKNYGGTIEKNNYSEWHYTGEPGNPKSLGDSFAFDPDKFQLAQRTVGYVNGENGERKEIKVPICQYIGDEKYGGNITIPDGISRVDYMFAGNMKLETVPLIPDSVKSMAFAFEDCGNLDDFCNDAKTGEKNEGNPLFQFFTGSHGGTVNAPKNVEDFCGAFKDCPKLSTSYIAWPPSAVDVRMSFSGDYSLDSIPSRHENVFLMQNPEMQANAYMLVNAKVVTEQTAAETRMYEDASGPMLNRIDSDYLYDSATKRDAASRIARQRKRELTNLNHVVNLSETKTANGASVLSYVDENGKTAITYDPDQSDQDLKTGGLADRLGAGALTFLGSKAVTRMFGLKGLTGTLVSGGVVLLTQLSGNKYLTSVSPMIRAIANMCPEGGFKNGLTSFADMISGTHHGPSDNLQGLEVVNQAVQRGTYSSAVFDAEGYEPSMYGNGYALATGLNTNTDFLAMAGEAREADVRQAGDTVKASCRDWIESEYMAISADGLSKEEAEHILKEYQLLANGTKAYEDGLAKGAAQMHAGDTTTEGIDKARAGIDNIMSTMNKAVYGSVYELAQKDPAFARAVEDMKNSKEDNFLTRISDYGLNSYDQYVEYENSITMAGIDETIQENAEAQAQQAGDENAEKSEASDAIDEAVAKDNAEYAETIQENVAADQAAYSAAIDEATGQDGLSEEDLDAAMADDDLYDPEPEEAPKSQPETLAGFGSTPVAEVSETSTTNDGKKDAEPDKKTEKKKSTTNYYAKAASQLGTGNMESETESETEYDG